MNQKKTFLQRIRTGAIISILSFSLLIPPENALAIQSNGTSSIRSSFYHKNYNDISNTKYDWWFMRNKTHQKVQGGTPTDINLSKYDAYFLDEKTNEKVIYLTFDCGYENGYTKKLLKTLKKHGAKAMFFVTKNFIEDNPQLARQFKEDGHMVGNHTCSHPSLPSKSVSQIKKEINDCADIFQKATGYKMDAYIRPPMGCYSKRTLQVTKDLGYKTIFWSMAYYDYDVNKQPGKNYVLDHFKENYHKGAIPLIHNISKSNCQALDEVLTFLEKKGYRFGTLDEFTAKKGTLKISCANRYYNGKPATVKIIKNTNRDKKITYTFKNQNGKEVKKAIKPGKYTVTAKVDSNGAFGSAISNTVTFTIRKPKKLTFWEALNYLCIIYDNSEGIVKN